MGGRRQTPRSCFFVSPSLRSQVRRFRPHSLRICEITIDTHHPIIVVNIYHILYAPHLVPSKILKRTVNKKSNFGRISRTLFSIDLMQCIFSFGVIAVPALMQVLTAHTIVGPATMGRRQTMPEPERDNSRIQRHMDAWSPKPFRNPFGTWYPITCTDHTLRRTLSYNGLPWSTFLP